MTDKTININIPVLARVEGEGALDLRIENGKISSLALRIFEPPRFFEKFLEGRHYQEVPDIVARICGICPVAYQMSAVHAIENLFECDPGPWVRDMRRLLYCGEWIESHALHIHLLAAPDFLGYPDAPSLAKDFPKEVRRGLKLQGLGNDIIRFLGGRSVHPVGVKVGGFYHAPDASSAKQLLEKLEAALDDVGELLIWTTQLPLPDEDHDYTYVAMHHPTEYPMNEGRIASSKGLNIAANAFSQHFVEHHQSHSTALHCLLEGQPYLLGPLARLNLNYALLPVEIQASLTAAGMKLPSGNPFHSVIARAAEIYFAMLEAVRLLRSYQQPAQSFVDVTPQAGITYACTEAPRGILWHRYEFDENGIVTKARIVPPTSQNQAQIEHDLRQSLQQFGLDKDQQSIRLHAEKIIRNYDPCISCATHFLDLTVTRL